MQYKLSVKKPNTFVLLMLISYATVSAVLFAPGIPAMNVFFAVSNATVQFTVITFLLAYAVGQLFYGILSNRFGRKKTIYWGMVVAVFGTGLCILSGVLQSFLLLLIGRFIEALGAGVGLALTFVIINDYFFRAQAVKITAWAAIAFAVSPGISSTIGGFLVAHLGWLYCFWFLALYGLLLIMFCVKLPETSDMEKIENLNMGKIIAAYKGVFTNKQLVSFSVLIGSTTAILYVFLSVVPIIVINHLGVRTEVYGMLNLILTCGLILGNIIVLQISGKTECRALIRSGIVAISVGIGGCALFLALKMINVYSLFSMGFMIFLGIALLYSSAATLAMSTVEDKAYGAAAMSFMNVGTACLCMAIVSLFSEISAAVVLVSVLLLFVSVMLWAYFLGKATV